MPTPFRLLALALAAWALVAATPLTAQTVNTRLLSQLPLGLDDDTGDLWAEGNYIYVARGEHGLDIIDASNQAAPVGIANTLPFAHADFSDVVVRGHYAYVANELTNGSPTPWVGMFIYDVSNPANPVEAGRIEWGAGAWYHLGVDAHSVFVDVTPGGVIAYLSSGITGDLEIFDVSNPALPVYLAGILSPVFSYNSQAHDAVVMNGRCYTAWLGGGFTVHDVSNPAAPVLLAHVPNASVNTVFTYHLWPTADGLSLCTTYENASGPDGVKVWNLSNLGSITLAGTFSSSSGALAHSVAVKGKYAYLAHTTDGLRILDLSNPALPRSVGWYDTDPTTAAVGFSGAMGVFPFQNNVYVSHRTRGLYVIDFVDTIAIPVAEWNKRTRTLTVQATSSAAPSPTLTVTGHGAMTYNTGTGRYTLTRVGVNQPGSVTVTSDLGATATASVRRR